MTKKACCCNPPGTYIAIPCKAFATIGIASFNQIIFPNASLGRPVRNGAFDSSREVLYMVRGGGGGANANTASKGGNGAYAEYKINAQLNYRVSAGSGGLAGNTSQNSTVYAGGGIAYTTAGIGGGGSVLGINASSTSHSGAIVGGGGGSGRGVVGAGGHGGITSGIDGSGTAGGKGASQTAPGAAGGGNALPGNVTRGGRGAFQSQSPFPLGLGGGGGGGKFGGGGGGDSSGGGGGSSTQSSTRSKYSFDGSDDGTGAMCNPFSSGFFGFGGNRKSKAAQDGNANGIQNNNATGITGSVTAYWIDRWCPCGDSINNLPTGPIFLCLNQAQYDSLIDQAGQQPSATEVITFTISEELYLFIPDYNICAEDCESVFKTEDPNEIPINVNWRSLGTCNFEGPICNSFNQLYGNYGGFYSPCCRFRTAIRKCPVPGQCGSCGCGEPPLNAICCNVDDYEDYPNTYIGIYKGWYYLVYPPGVAWYEFGTTLQSLNAEKICIDPVYTEIPPGFVNFDQYLNSVLCNSVTNECVKIATSNEYEKCCIDEPNCLNFIFSGETCVAEWWNSFPCLEISGERCIPTGRRQDISMSGILTTGLFNGIGYSAPMGLPVDPTADGGKQVTMQLSSHPPDYQAVLPLENQKEVALTITYECVPDNFDITNPTGIPLPIFYPTPDGYNNISICATNGNFPEPGYVVKIDESKALKLENIASAFNSMSAPFTMTANDKVWYNRIKNNGYNCLGDIIDWFNPEYSLGGTVDNPTVIVKIYAWPYGYNLKQTASASEDPKDLPNVGSYAERYTESPISQWEWEESYSNLNSYWGNWISRCGYVSDAVGTADPTYLCKVRIDCDQTDGSASYNWCVWPAGLCIPCQDTDLPNATTICQDNVSAFTFNIF